MSESNAYDELPYRCLPVEWTAPERLAVTSLMHGGPRQPPDGYRVLELGCGDGANLLPLAYYRPASEFVGVDGALRQIEAAAAGARKLKLANLEFIHADFRAAQRHLSGTFDFIIAHGVFSWVPEEVRDDLFELCDRHLSTQGLLYLNYNCYPGWKVRGLVRDFLLTQTAAIGNLADRAQQAQRVAEQFAAALRGHDHPYSQLMANEFEFVCENHASYVAHEYLAAENRAYWRSEFLELARKRGFGFVADADYCYRMQQVPEHLLATLQTCNLAGNVHETTDLLCYRQLHSPVFTRAAWIPQPVRLEEFTALWMASSLRPKEEIGDIGRMFEHPSGYEVEAKDAPMRRALSACSTFGRAACASMRCLRTSTTSCRTCRSCSAMD